MPSILCRYTSYKLTKCHIAIAVEKTKLKIAIITLSFIFVSTELIWKLVALNKQGSHPSVSKLIAEQLTRRTLRVCFVLTLSWLIVFNSEAYDAREKILTTKKLWTPKKVDFPENQKVLDFSRTYSTKISSLFVNIFVATKIISKSRIFNIFG